MNSDMVPKWRMNAFQSKHRQSNIKYLISRGKGQSPKALGKLMDLKLDKLILSGKYPCRSYSKRKGFIGVKKKWYFEKFYPHTDIWNYMKLSNMKN